MRKLAALTTLLLSALAGVAVPAFGAVLAGAAGPTAASTKLVSYRGFELRVPTNWPVYNLTTDPSVCVRFNRHAVYLGPPGDAQLCPAHSVGRTEAILVQPSSSPRGPMLAAGDEATLRHGAVTVTATWAQNPGLVRQALGERALTAAVPARPRPGAERRDLSAAQSRPPRATAASVTYTGLGFDACSAPSSATMSAWSASPYRALGIYIGGTNMGCAQANLTAAWVAQQSAAGWHVIPTYVGLQAPTNSCGCAPISAGQAAAQGAAAAADAVAQGQALGIAAGNPIYYDMEAYPPNAKNSPTVLAFLAAWTNQLHTDGYLSGVYSSADSGVHDLVAQVGTTYPEPDELWIAAWNGQQSTSDPNVPAIDWSQHQRLHQYEGAHNETYGGATINIDGDYVDAATAPQTAPPPPPPIPTLTVTPAGDGSVQLSASWPTTTPFTGWEFLGGANPSTLAPVTGIVANGPTTAMTIRSSFPYFSVETLDSGGQVVATSAPVATPAFVAAYGHSVFAPPRGLTGLPVGCFAPGGCHVTTTVTAGRSVIASTGHEAVPANSGGLVYFKLSTTGQRLLRRAHHHQLPVKATITDSSGLSATEPLNLVGFKTTGRGPHRSLTDPSTLRLIGATDFVSHNTVGGILAGCFASAPCSIATTISAGSITIARTGPEAIGAGELGYLLFTLTQQGRWLLAHAAGNQLATRVTIANGTTTATGTIALVGF